MERDNFYRADPDKIQRQRRFSQRSNASARRNHPGSRQKPGQRMAIEREGRLKSPEPITDLLGHTAGLML